MFRSTRSETRVRTPHYIESSHSGYNFFFSWRLFIHTGYRVSSQLDLLKFGVNFFPYIQFEDRGTLCVEVTPKKVVLLALLICLLDKNFNLRNWHYPRATQKYIPPIANKFLLHWCDCYLVKIIMYEIVGKSKIYRDREHICCCQEPRR